MLQLLPVSNLSTKTLSMPVLASIPVASWVTGDNGLKSVSSMAWDKVKFHVEEIAVIIPIPEAVLDDADFDIEGQIKAGAGSAIGVELDRTVLLGTENNGKPESWPDGLIPQAIAAGKVYSVGTNSAAKGGIVADLSDAFALVEKSGTGVNGVIAASRFKRNLRVAQNGAGNESRNVDSGQVFTVPVSYTDTDVFTDFSAGAPVALIGDFTRARIGQRQDVTYKLLTEASLYNADKSLLYALAQQDMVAFRVVARYAFVVANPINFGNIGLTAADRFPFAVITQG